MCLANPGMRALVCRKTAVSLTSTGLVRPFPRDRRQGGHRLRRAEVLRRQPDRGGQLPVRERLHDHHRRPGQGIVEIMSSEYDVIYVQEATELVEDDWEALTTRLRNGKVTFQQLMADCNPGPPQHWLNRAVPAQPVPDGLLPSRGQPAAVRPGHP